MVGGVEEECFLLAYLDCLLFVWSLSWTQLGLQNCFQQQFIPPLPKNFCFVFFEGKMTNDKILLLPFVRPPPPRKANYIARIK